jgi:hypothetical protein
MGETPPVEFVANGHTNTKGYYIADATYPMWTIFVKPLVKPQGKK